MCSFLWVPELALWLALLNLTAHTARHHSQAHTCQNHSLETNHSHEHNHSLARKSHFFGKNGFSAKIVIKNNTRKNGGLIDFTPRMPQSAHTCQNRYIGRGMEAVSIF